MTPDELAKQAGVELPRVAAKRGRADVATEEKLLAAIRTPNDTEAWGAYATWLCAQGDPLGRVAIIARACHELAQREANLLLRHRRALLGPLKDWIDLGWLEVTWRAGYLKYVQISVDAPLGVKECELVNTLFDHPSARILTELRLSRFDIHAMEQQALVDAVIARRPQTLRELEVSGAMGRSCGDLSGVWPAFPELRYLTAFGRDVELGEIDAPVLATLDVHLLSLTQETIERLAAARAPALATLRLAGVDATHLVTLRPILAGTSLPALRKLLLTNVGDCDEVAAALLGAPNLTTVALWNSDVSKATTAKLKKRFGEKLFL